MSEFIFFSYSFRSSFLKFGNEVQLRIAGLFYEMAEKEVEDINVLHLSEEEQAKVWQVVKEELTAFHNEVEQFYEGTRKLAGISPDNCSDLCYSANEISNNS